MSRVQSAILVASVTMIGVLLSPLAARAQSVCWTCDMCNLCYDLAGDWGNLTPRPQYHCADMDTGHCGQNSCTPYGGECSLPVGGGGDGGGGGYPDDCWDPCEYLCGGCPGEIIPGHHALTQLGTPGDEPSAQMMTAVIVKLLPSVERALASRSGQMDFAVPCEPRRYGPRPMVAAIARATRASEAVLPIVATVNVVGDPSRAVGILGPAESALGFVAWFSPTSGCVVRSAEYSPGVARRSEGHVAVGEVFATVVEFDGLKYLLLIRPLDFGFGAEGMAEMLEALKAAHADARDYSGPRADLTLRIAPGTALASYAATAARRETWGRIKTIYR